MAQTITIDRDEAEREIAIVEKALEEGHPPPPGKGRISNFVGKSALRIAALRLGISISTIRTRMGAPGEPGIIERYHGIKVDWSKYRPESMITSPIHPPDNPAGMVAADQVDLRRKHDEIDRLKIQLRDTQRRAAAAEDIRAGVLGLRDMPPPPVSFPPREASTAAATSSETVVLMLSDLQWGEVVWINAMDGLNSYNLDIARCRLGKWTHAVCDLLTKHWAGPPPERIILILGGDMISGGIHFELAKTDALRPLPAVRDVAEHLLAAITTIHKEVHVPIDVISLPGNHGRTTIKPESKEATATSLDILVSDFLEVGLKGRKGINFFAPHSPDALFSVYGWRVLASHGDKIGSRGGQGFVGPAATAARGFKRMIADYAARGVHVDLIVIGHFHAPMQLEEGFVNGSLPGPTEYSRDGRFRPHPAMQLMFVMHPKHRVTLIRWIEVGSPEEGALYDPPPPDRPLRPRYRVKGISKTVPPVETAT